MNDSPSNPEPMDGLQFSIAAALSRQYESDQRQFLEMLALMFETSLPEFSEVRRQGGLFAKKSVRSVNVTLGDRRYTLMEEGRGPLKAARTHIVRGIALKTEEIPIEEWIGEVCGALEEKARSGALAREALSKLVG